MFTPVNGMSQSEYFINQMRTVNNTLNTDGKCNDLVTGDFNHDDSKKFAIITHITFYLKNLNDIIDNQQLTQLINFTTWERLIGGTFKTSILDHVYVKDFKMISNITSTKPMFCDHLLITFDISFES